MKRLITCSSVVAMIVVLALAGGGCVAARSEPAPSGLQPRDLTPVTQLTTPVHPPVELVRDGQARAVVYVANPKDREALAGKKSGNHPSALKLLVNQLVDTIQLATGVTLDRVDQAPASDRPAVVIGDCEESRRAGIDAARIPVEGFVVKTASNRVYLVGSTQPMKVPGEDNGTAWAVADFLERFVGVRWYWPTSYGGRSVPRAASLVITPAHYRDQPVFRFRRMYQDWYWTQARSFDEQLLPLAPSVFPYKPETLWMGDHFLLMRQGVSWPYDAVQQGSRIYEFISKAPRTNETMFAVREDGSRNFDVFCYSAPATLACYLDNLERAWDKDGKGVFIGGIRRASVTVWTPLDLGGNSRVAACHCPACRAMLAAGGEEQLMGRFVQSLCEQVKRRWPGKTVIYVPWAIPKYPEGLKFPDNLLVNSLNLDVMGLMQQPSIRREEEGNLRMWGTKSGHPVHTWVDFAGPSDWTYGPVQFPHLVKDFYQTNRDCIEGGMVLTYGGACFITAAPTYYVWNRVLWNPELDVEATLDEMCRRLFGAGAESARELLRIECARWEKTPLSRPLRVGEHRIPPILFRELWPADVVARMKTLRDKALADIERAGDAEARKSFLYWTWAFDAFADYSQALEQVFARDAQSDASGNASPNTAPVVATNAAAEARFQGGTAAVNHARIANVRRQEGPVEGQSDIRFDLSCGHTWRAAWTEPAANNVTGRELPVESWSGVWIFAKYRPAGRDVSKGYSCATLSAVNGDHAVPAAAVLDVGLTGGKGVGAFVYRAQPGRGPLDLSGVKLRWLNGADGVTNPAAADLKVFALEMVYVPRGAFTAGSGGTERGGFTDGVWTNGATVPLRVDEEWSRPVADGSPARRLGPSRGRLWGTSKDGAAAIGPEGELDDRFPTGVEAFYCMRYEVTREQFAAFLNTVPREVFDGTTAGDSAHAGGHYTAVGRYDLSGVWPHLKPAKPYQACNLLSWWDCARYAAWAGLRPMTELEYEKACRGPRKPVGNEYAWGTPRIATAEYVMANEGKADEHVTGNGGSAEGNACYDFTLPATCGAARGGVSVVPGSPVRVGLFATPDSGRIEAGASYWGIMELSGNVREQMVTVSDPKGRAFRGTPGAGTPEAPEDWPVSAYGKDYAAGSGARGGFFGDMPLDLQVSDRLHAAYRPRPGAFAAEQVRQDQNGFRAVRTASK